MKKILTSICFLLMACNNNSVVNTNNVNDGSDEAGTGVVGDKVDPPCGNDISKQPARCVDSFGAILCKASTGYSGDESALCKPDPSVGQLIHFGPSSYDDPDALAPYILAPGGEEEFCIHANTTNIDPEYYNSYHGRMRPSSHHWIVTMPKASYQPEAKPYVCPPNPIDRWVFGSQSPQIDVEALTGGGDPSQPGDPDYGAAHDLPAEQTMLMDLHYVNTSDQPILREAWAVIKYVDPSEVKVKIDLIGFYNPNINIPSLAHYVTPRVTCKSPSTTDPVYLGLVTGHAHRRLQRLSLWHQDELVYETHNWHEPGEAMFRDGTSNPILPLAAGQDWGAKTGYLKVMPGENVSFECEYQNDLNNTVTFGDTTKDEMCNIFGFYYPTTGQMWNCF